MIANTKVCDLTHSYVLEADSKGYPLLSHYTIEGKVAIQSISELAKEWCEIVEKWQAALDNDLLRAQGDIRYQAASTACNIWKGMLNEKADSLSLEVFAEGEISVPVPGFCTVCSKQIENNEKIKVVVTGNFVINRQLNSIAIVDADTYLLCPDCIWRY